MLALNDMHSSQRSLTWPDASFILAFIRMHLPDKVELKTL